MRRATFAATLAALLAAPAVARAQVPPVAGQVTFDNPYIGADGCSSTATPQHTVRMSWIDQSLGTGGSNAGVFKIVATNVAPPSGQVCPLVNNLTANPQVYAGQVGADIPNVGTQLSGNKDGVSTSDIIAKAGYAACSQDGVPVFVCVQFYPYDQFNVPTTTATAFAIGTMTLSLSTPSSAHLDEVLPGNGALNVDWGGSATKYKVVALSMADPTTAVSSGAFVAGSAYATFNPADPTRHETGFITGTGPFRMSGLVNYVPYAVSVVAYSAADSAAEPSNVLTSEPQPVNDFWRLYKAAGGQEAGGCSSGLAGPLGLGILIATLALVRRRK